jgi:hypothetical protein
MYRINTNNEELKKLYTLLNKVSNALLGSDPQTRRQFLQIKQNIIYKIKTIEQQLDSRQ